MLPILAILAALFASYSAVAFLADAVSGLLPANTIAEVVGLKLLISLEVLIPIALYVAVVLSLGRFHSDSEFVAAYALRVTPAKVMRAVLTVSGALAIAVGGLSLAVRPWAYQKLNELSTRAERTLDVGAMRAGTFYVSKQGNQVVFFSRQDGPGLPARDVFLQIWRGDEIQVIHAGLAYETARKAADGGSRIDLHDAHVYEIGTKPGMDDQLFSAGDMIVNPNDRPGAAPAHSSVAASSLTLAGSNSAPDIAELQWRLSTPLSTLLLGALGIPMSRARPRQSRYTRLGTAILIYFGYYMLFTSARTWVQHGAIAGIPGIWWVPALLSLFLLAAALHAPGRALQFGRG